MNSDTVALVGLIASLITIFAVVIQGYQAAKKRKLPEQVLGDDEHTYYYFRLFILEALYIAAIFILFLTKAISASVSATMFVFGIIITVAMIVFPNALKQYNNARHTQSNEEDLTPPQDN